MTIKDYATDVYGALLVFMGLQMGKTIILQYKVNFQILTPIRTAFRSIGVLGSRLTGAP